ncbi:MAG TPA: AMP-binding protein [Blastocatellia bacterium]|nr:AMP-binding protein [Blastocatellia bacterium]
MMRTNLITFLDDCLERPRETAFAHRRGLRVNRWSYLKVRQTAFQFARELESRHISKGDRVLFWAENSAEWVAAFFGCLARGVIVVPLDVESAPEFVRRVQKQVEARFIIYSARKREDAGLELPGIAVEELSRHIAHHAGDAFSIAPSLDDIAEIIFTSGTTADPKGVVLTHRNLLTNLAPLQREIKKYLKWERPFHPVRFLNLVPLSHVFGQFMGIFVPLLLGGEVYFQDSLNPSEIIETVKKNRVSVIVAVPRLLDSLRDKLERDYESRGRLERFREKLAAAAGVHFLKRWWLFRDIHRRFGWKFWAFVSGGAALSAETEEFWQRLGYAVVQGYGMTETAAIVSVNHPFKLSRGSIGKAMPGQELKLDETGEILVRGDNVSPGYWSGAGRPLMSEDGWLRTGDIGERDEAGNLYFKSRKKDTIVTAAGLNIYPDDLEAALDRQPEVRASCVVGIEGPRGPEAVAALIMRDERADAAAAINRANETLAQHQRIRRWVIWPERDFPRTPTQKVRKLVVAEAIKSSQANGAGPHRAADTLAELISRVSGEPSVELSPTANLTTDLKLDSLGRVELLSAIEDRYQVDIDESAFTAATTLADIERMINRGATQTAAGHSYPEWTQRFPATWIRVAVYYLVILPITRLMCWVRAEEKRRLDGLGGPALFIANHVSMIDHGLILSALPGRFRRNLAIAMEGERLRGYRNPPQNVSWLTRLVRRAQYVLIVTLFNTFPLPQKSGFRRAFAYAGESVDRDYSLLVFPEGRTTDDGRMRPFMGGIGLLASDLGLPIVPIKIEGLFELKEKRKYFSRPGSVRIIFGGPVRYTPGADPAEITKDLEARVASL